nr:hypothetical protein [Tanacetum cinerariifolium]
MLTDEEIRKGSLRKNTKKRGNGGEPSVDEVPEFSTVITQQLKDLLPTIIAQVGNHASNIQVDVRSVNNRGRKAAVVMTWEDFKVLMRKEFCQNNEMQKLEHTIVRAGHVTYTDQFHELARNGNVRDDNKRSRTGRVFATTTNPVRRKYMGHFAKDCRAGPRMMTPVNAKNPTTTHETCFVCGGTDHYKTDPNIRTGTFTLNNHYATTLFNFDADYSFDSTTFITLLDIEPSDLDFIYEIEIASRQLVEINKVIRDCKLEIEGHTFDSDLIPFGHESFDVIVGMDWLSQHKDKIIFHEKKRQTILGTLENLTLYDNESWNDPIDIAKPVKAISLPQDVLMNKITSSCEICSGPHDTEYYMENPEQAFVDYASSRTDEARDKPFLEEPTTNKDGTGTQQTKEPEQTLEDEFKDLHLNLPVLEVLAHVLIHNAILDKYVEAYS